MGSLAVDASDITRAATLVAPGVVELVEESISSASEPYSVLRVLACGVCGTDFDYFDGMLPSDKLPVVLGHEIIAAVEHIGSGWAGRDLKVGEVLALEEKIPCHNCRECLAGMHRLCQYGYRYGATGALLGARMWGGFADRVLLHPQSVFHRVPDGLTPVDATFFIPLSNGISWIHEAGRLQPGDVVVVLGPGQHGLGCVIAAVRGGASIVVTVGTTRDVERLELARSLGSSVTVNRDDIDPDEIVLELTDGRGADLIIDATNSPRQNLESMIRMAAPRSRLVVAARQRGEIDGSAFTAVFRREVSIRGVNARSSQNISEALRILAMDDFAEYMPTADVVPLDEIGQLLKHGRGRSVHSVVLP